ncbi:hypothetical protein T03_14523 [Trichinella britovi]|uniref:Uncharacterized protein n=1 Tax=Trichinella britovi TaxID=45882 RepID=A0A0V1CG79_TRIBR|nr:hypothetical protein T03_14523 [Trichinella britovi]
MKSHEACTDGNQCSPGALMAFSSRPSVPLLITNRRNFILFMTAMKYQWITSSSENFCLDRRFHSNCVSYCSDVFPCHASKEREVLVRSIEYFKVLIYFIHDSITLTSSEYDISSDGAVS